MKENQIKYMIAAAAVVLFGVLWIFTGQKRDQGGGEENGIFNSEMDSGEEEKTDLSEGKIYVHITGEVKNPGVYIFEKKPRVIEVVEKAGGFKKCCHIWDQSGRTCGGRYPDCDQEQGTYEDFWKGFAGEGTAGAGEIQSGGYKYCWEGAAYDPCRNWGIQGDGDHCLPGRAREI